MRDAFLHAKDVFIWTSARYGHRTSSKSPFFCNDGLIRRFVFPSCSKPWLDITWCRHECDVRYPRREDSNLKTYSELARKLGSVTILSAFLLRSLHQIHSCLISAFQLTFLVIVTVHEEWFMFSALIILRGGSLLVHCKFDPLLQLNGSNWNSRTSFIDTQRKSFAFMPSICSNTERKIYMPGDSAT